MPTRTVALSALGLLAATGFSTWASDRNETHGPATVAARQAATPAADQHADAYAKLTPTEGNHARGQLRLIAEANGVRVMGTISGLTPHSKHGVHVHQNGDCNTPDASSAGSHFAPFSHPHGPPGPSGHVGDLGNITANDAGIAFIDAVAARATLNPATPTDISKRAIIVHAEADDLVTQPSGNSGARIACGAIQQAPPSTSARASEAPSVAISSMGG